MNYHVFNEKERKQLFKCLSSDQQMQVDEMLEIIGDDYVEMNKYFNKVYVEARLSIARDIERVMSKKGKVRNMDFQVDELHEKTSKGISDGSISDSEADEIFSLMSYVKSLIDEREEELVEEIVQTQKREKHMKKLTKMINSNSNGNDNTI